MKRVLLSGILFFIMYTLFAQIPTYQWANSTLGYTSSIAVGSNNTIYNVGSFTGTVDFDPGPGITNLVSSGSSDIFIRAMSTTGGFIWVKKIGSSQFQHATAVMLDANNNIYVTGYFGGPGTVDFDPGIPIYNLNNGGAGQYEIFVLKLNQYGQFIWARQMGDANNSSDMGYSVAVDGDGNVYTTGSFTQTAGFGTTYLTPPSTSPQVFVSKIYANGNYGWAKQLGGTGTDEGNAITVDDDGNVYTTGYFNGTGDFDPGAGTFNLTSAGLGDIFISKLDSGGNFVYAKQMGGISEDNATDIVLDDNGNIHTTGYFSVNGDFDPGPGTFNFTSSSNDGFVSKLDPYGNFIWAKQIGGVSNNDWCYSIDLGDNGNVYIAGRFLGTTDLDPGVDTASFTSLGSTDLYITKLDSSGNFVWAGAAGAGNMDDATSIDFYDGGIYSSGGFYGTVDFDPGAGTSNLTSAGANFLWKLSDCSIIVTPSFITGPDTVCPGSTHTYSVINDAGATSYSWTLPSGWTGSSTTNSITLTAGTNSGNISVVANNACGTSAAAILPVTVITTPGAPGTISGNTAVCIGATNTYSITPVTGATSYSWTSPLGWTGTSSVDSILLTASSSTGNITVTANNTCGSSSPASLSILSAWTTPATPGTISGPNSICAGSTNTYSVVLGSMVSSYNWTLPATWGGTSTSELINATAGSTGGNILVTASNFCGTSSPSSLLINITPVPATPGSISGPGTICEGSTNNYSISGVVGATSYSWSLPLGWTNTSTTNSITTTANATSGNVSVTANNACGNSSPQILVVVVNGLPGVTFIYPGADTVCTSYGMQSLSGGSPAGGIYSGTAVSGTSFDPGTAGVGSHNIQYSFTDANSCSNAASVSIVVIGCAGIDENGNSTTINIYPNPFTSQITIDGVMENSAFKLYNSLGQEINNGMLDASNYQISTVDLREGVYYIKVMDENGRVGIYKLVKE